MKYIIVGLGNPGEEYENSRHNVGRMFVASFKENSNVKIVLPDTFMNKSGLEVKKYVTSVKNAERLIVVHDDLDLPIGRFKISFGRGSGGHKGIESIVRSIKTKDFARVRIGISPTTPSGKLKKPKGDKKVHDFILGNFTKKEMETLKKMKKKVNDALSMIIKEGRAKAMNTYN